MAFFDDFDRRRRRGFPGSTGIASGDAALYPQSASRLPSPHHPEAAAGRNGSVLRANAGSIRDSSSRMIEIVRRI